MYEDIKLYGSVLFMSLFVMLGFLLILSIPMSLLYQHQCHSQAELATAVTDARYGYINGCFWEVNGQWIPADSYRTVDQ